MDIINCQIDQRSLNLASPDTQQMKERKLLATTSNLRLRSTSRHNSSSRNQSSSASTSKGAMTIGNGELPHYNGLSICCYAPLMPYESHFTCSDCSTLFNKVSLSLGFKYFDLERSDDIEGRVWVFRNRYFTIWAIQAHACARTLTAPKWENEGLWPFLTTLFLCTEWLEKEVGSEHLRYR